MKQNRFTTFPITLFSLTTLSAIGCARAENPVTVTPPPAKESPAATTAIPGPSSEVQIALAAVAERPAAKWTDIEEHNFDMRAAFFTGLARLEAQADAQVKMLMARRAGMKGPTDTRDWDFAMKEMENARSYLKSMGEEASKATSETWQQQKTKVGQAWVRTQSAYDKVKSSTTG